MRCYPHPPLRSSLSRWERVGVSAPSTYYRHIARRKDASKLPARLQKDILLTAHIMRVWNDNHQVYGVGKILHQLKREGIKIAKCTVARIMKVLGLQGVRRHY